MSAPRDLILIGGGEHATVIVDAARSRSDLWRVIGYLNAAPTPKMEASGIPCFGDEPAGIPETAWLIVATGSLGVSSRRADLVRRFGADRFGGWATVVHARACVSPTAEIKEGVLIAAGAIVNPGASIGAHCIVNTGAIVEHDVSLGDFTQVAPAAVLGGGARVGNESFLGLGCRIRDHVRIGQRVTVGMGAVVIGSVADGATVVGVPARPRAGTGGES